MKARLSAAKKVQKLRAALKSASPAQRVKVEAKRVAKLVAYIKAATDPARKAALRKQLAVQKKVKELRK